jgi:hypothetical protein
LRFLDEPRSQSGHCLANLVSNGKEANKDEQLRDVVDVAHTRRSCDFGGILLIPIELCVDVFRDLGEWIRGVLGPEKILRVEVIGPLQRRCDRDAIQLHFEAIGDEGLICPAV